MTKYQNVIVSDLLNKFLLSHLYFILLWPCKAKGQLKIDHKTETDSVYLET